MEDPGCPGKISLKKHRMKILYLKDPFEEDDIEGDEEDEDDDHADEHRDVLGAVQLVARTRRSTFRSDRGRDTC